jgi:hypothetical protein
VNTREIFLIQFAKYCNRQSFILINLYSFICNNFHRLVEETLEPLDPDRRAFRLVGGVLVRSAIVLCAAYFLILFNDNPTMLVI